jgi:selenocysteine-specific elongation factor
MGPSENLVLGTAGHIDHGKTALVRALTGINTDRLPAERERGITIDLGFAWLDLGDSRIGVVDVPGHERFIRNMLAGATGLDLAMLVVAADDSVMPQTREHLEILRLLGLPGGVVALTKCDLVDADWVSLVEEEIRTLVAGTFLEGAAVVRTSSTTGQGIDELRAELARVVASAPERSDSGLFRMAIDRSFTVAGHGTVVTGTVASGTVRVGDELEWHPQGRLVRVRGLRRHDQVAESLERGSRAAINLGGVHHREIERGQELATTGYLKSTRVLSVELHPSAESTRGLRHRGRYRVHLGTAEVTATLSLLEPRKIEGGQISLGQLLLAEPVVAVHAQPFILRQESPPSTVGGGRVLHPTMRRLRRRASGEIGQLTRLQDPDAAARLTGALAFQRLNPWTAADLVREAGIRSIDVDRALQSLASSGALVELPVGPRRTVRVLAEVATELEGRVLRALKRLHESRPRQSTVRRTHVAAELPDLANDTLVSGLMDRLAARGEVLIERGTVALRGHEPKLSQAERRLKAELVEAYRAGGFSPPDAAALKATAGAQAKALPELIALLVDEGEIVELGRDFQLAARWEVELRQRVTDKLADGASLTMSDLRDLLGTTRKYAVPIGEYLDRVGVTVRDGDLRRLGSADLSATVAGPAGVELG